jgi:chromosome segregation ATPase
MDDALLIEVLGENESLEKQNESLKKQNESLKEHIARSEDEISFLETVIGELQSALACFRIESNETNIQTMEAMRLMARNLDRIKQENEVLQANQELHMGVISDLKGEILEGKINQNQMENQMEKQCTNTTALFASFDSFPEPWMMELKLISQYQSAPKHSDNFRSTTSC